MTGARVLTSSECLAIIREKELQKKKMEEEKEERKRVREEKKKKREEEKQKKAEERAKKAEERARKQVEKEEQKKKKAEEAKARAQEKAQASGKSATAVSRKRENLRSRADEAGPSSKTPRLDDTTVANRCCVCYQDYEEDVEIGAGTDWVMCSCTRWLHEDCVLDSIIDGSGKERLCPHCTYIPLLCCPPLLLPPFIAVPLYCSPPLSPTFANKTFLCNRRVIPHKLKFALQLLGNVNYNPVHHKV